MPSFNSVSLHILTLSCVFCVVLTDRLQAPRFYSQPSSSIVSENGAKFLQCQAIGYPQPEYRWIKDGEYITGYVSDPVLKIQSLRREHTGTYQCISKNSVGAIYSEPAKLVVAYMSPFSDKSERSVSVQTGHAAILALPALQSEPLSSVAWQNEAGAELYGLKYAIGADNNLIILSASAEDEGAYRCHATNSQVGQEDTSGPIRLLVEGVDGEDVAPQIIVAPENVEIAQGETVTMLRCIANASPLSLLEILWYKDDVPIERTEVVYSLDPWNRTLSLLNIEAGHKGTYACHAGWRNRRDVVVAAANVTVLEKPVLLEKFSLETFGDYGRNTHLPCKVQGFPQPEVSWYKNTEDVRDLPPGKYSVQSDGTLTIQTLAMTDSGVFQCIATNPAGRVSAYTWLKVKIGNDTFLRPGASPTSSSAAVVARVRLNDLTDLRLNTLKTNSASAPVMEVPPQNRTATVGKDETLVCKAADAGIPNVTWFFNDTSEITSTGRFQILEDGSLLIAAIRPTDAGKYTCVRSNEAGSVEGSAYLSVLVRTQIVQPPVDTRVILGHTATLQCKVSSDPSASYVLRWLRDKQLINATRSHRIQQLDDGTLQIAEARATDVGVYECQVTSTAGDDSRAARLDVIELPYAPTAVAASKLSNNGRAVNVSWVPGFNGNNPILKYIIQRRVVPITGPIPEPLGSWITELSNVSASARWVVLSNLKAAAAYQFRVSAVNSVGEGPASEPSNRVTLPQEVPSGPPVGLVGAARSSSQIMIQWNPPEEETRNGVIMGYVVRYRLHGYGQSPWSHKNITSEAQRNYLIEDLITWKDYEIQIAAYNQVGLGSYGPSIIAKTREGVPQAAPTGVRTLALNSTSIQVWWTPPDPQLVNGINQGYKLHAVPFDSELSPMRMAVPPSPFDPLAEQTAVMTGLDKFMSYNVTVLCFTSPGDGPYSLPVLAKTLEDVPNPVQNLSFNAITDRSVVVVWRPPARLNGNLTGYTVQWSIRDTPHTMKTRNVSAEVTSLLVEHLLPTTHYTFEVFGWTKIGAGPSSVATLQSGVEPVLPEPPTHLGVSNINAFSVVLQFTPGFDGNSSIITWTVQAQTSRNTTWYDIYEFRSPAPNTTALLVEPLIPFMEYSLRLIAHNVVGASVPSQPTQKFQTLQAPPAHPPFNMTVRAVSATELRVRWTPLQQIEWYGIPRGYNISYRRSGVNHSSESKSVVIQDHNSNSFVLKDLEEFATYEVVVKAFNDVGMSTPSPVAKERTREGVPRTGPRTVKANATSSTTIVVSWDQIPEKFRNGIILGYKVYYGAANIPFKNKEVLGNTTLTTTLTELKKFTSYQIQVRAYTKMGEGALSTVPIIAQTWEDVPGPPSNVSFPDVSLTSARVVWDVPDEANGQILAYRVAYVMEGRQERQSKDFAPMDRTYRVTNMESEQFYIFEVTAQTSQGWGQVALARVYTTNSREKPQAPSTPFISSSQIQARQVTFSWTPGRDGFAPLRYYTVEYREGLQAPWVTASERADPAYTSYTVQGLKPYTNYQVRLRAVNDMGPSNWSPNSEVFRTLSAPPAVQVQNVKVVPITTTSVRVSWMVLPDGTWNGDSATGMYVVEYRQIGDFPVLSQNSQKEEVIGVKSSYVVLDGLVRDQNYEVTVTPANSQGKGPSSPPATVFVGEAVPTGEPRNVTVFFTSPTELRLKWIAPAVSEQNGDLLGYKILYLAQGEGPEKEEMEVVPAASTSHSLSFLEMYTTYIISVLAFNPAGDGPRSTHVTATTLQGIPEAPGSLQFTEITMNSLRVSWDPPRKRNGEILGYLVTYETEKNNEVDFSKQVKQKVNGTSLSVFNLEEEVRYVFSVTALTVGYGPASTANVSTGPQPGSPGALRDLHLARTVSAVILKWENGLSGKDAVLGYYIESKKKDEDKWQPVVRTDSGIMTEYALSYQNLMPSSSYTFRVLAYNKYGVSCPVSTQEPILTPSKLYMEYGYLQQRPFYHQTWFLVTLAACSVVVITIVVATLCIKSKSHKYKSEAQKTLEESLTNDDTGFAFELRPTSKRMNSLSRNTLNRHSTAGTLSRDTLPRRKPPPRPAPSSVPYQSDEESAKAYDDNVDDSSLTEKPSELSSTDSNESDSEDGSQHSDPHSFVNHYANVNDTLRQSWKRQKPVKNYSSYTDSEQEGSAVMSLNGGQIVMNNMARSRAPLPGFSSFV